MYGVQLLARAIYGADKAQTGTLKVDGKEAKVAQPIDAMNLGMGLLPDDRKAESIIGDLSVRENIILARWLATDPDFLILDEPTRGIDVGTKTEIQKLIVKLAGEGKSILFISSEIEEMLRTCNRMSVLRDGAKVGELDGELTRERVMAAIAGGTNDE